MINVGLWLLGLVVVLVVGIELALRRIYGLGQPPLYVADARTGYRLAPNQSLRRFGNRIEVNQYSMRSGPVPQLRSQTSLRVLLLGDSIANGGWWTDQPQILSQQIEDRLQQSLPEPFQQAEVLNASANSWGPRNELGYVMRFGIFEAQVVVVLLNTDDLFAIAPTSIPVGRDRAYPQRRPPLALFELFSRLRSPRPLPAYEALLQEPGDRVGGNLEALRQLSRYVQAQDALLLVAMTPLKRELGPTGPRDYEIRARQRLIDCLMAAGIVYLDFLPVFDQHPDADSLYRDHIHLSPQGYHLVRDHLVAQILQLQVSGQAAQLPQAPDSSIHDPWE